jgi:hypothetical protein
MSRLTVCVGSVLIAVTFTASGAASHSAGLGLATDADPTPPLWLPPAALSTAPSHEPSVSLNARGDAVAVWRDRDTGQVTARVRPAASGSVVRVLDDGNTERDHESSCCFSSIDAANGHVEHLRAIEQAQASAPSMLGEAV